MFCEIRIVDDAPFKQKVHVNLVVFRSCLLFEQKKVNHVAHLLALIYFECSVRLASLFIRDQISEFIIQCVEHHFACSILQSENYCCKRRVFGESYRCNVLKVGLSVH